MREIYNDYGELDLEYEEIEVLAFGYFFLGVLLPGFWGYLFLSFALDPIYYRNNYEQCQLLIDWSLVAGVIFLIHAFFYMTIGTFACLGRAITSWYPKFLRFEKFEDHYWRSFVLTFSLLGLFGILGVMNTEYEAQFLACASFAIIACLIQCTLETNMLDDADEEETESFRAIQQQRSQRRRARQQRNEERNRNQQQNQQRINSMHAVAPSSYGSYDVDVAAREQGDLEGGSHDGDGRDQQQEIVEGSTGSSNGQQDHYVANFNDRVYANRQ